MILLTANKYIALSMTMNSSALYKINSDHHHCISMNTLFLMCKRVHYNIPNASATRKMHTRFPGNSIELFMNFIMLNTSSKPVLRHRLASKNRRDTQGSFCSKALLWVMEEDPKGRESTQFYTLGEACLYLIGCLPVAWQLCPRMGGDFCSPCFSCMCS